jgi:P4 family phage/plasmid primase-like protien
VKTIHDYASLYVHNYNLSVTPVKGKRPMFNDWPKVTGESILDKKYNTFWRSATGVGLLCGEPSGIICLDIDILDDNEKLRDVLKLIESKLPPIYLGRIGNTKKPPARFFRYNGEKNRKFKYIDVELLSTGNQVILPPSIHPDTGDQYKWFNFDISQINLDNIPLLPKGFIEFLERLNNEHKPNKTTNGNNGSYSKYDLTPEHGRCNHQSHNYISDFAMAKFYEGISYEDLVSAVINYDKKINADADFVYFQCPSRKEWKGSKNVNANARLFVNQIFQNPRNEGEHGRDLNNLSDVDKKYAKEIESGFTHIEVDKNGKEKAIRHYFEFKDYVVSKGCYYLPDAKKFVVWNGKYFEYKLDDHIKKTIQDTFNHPKIIHEHERNTALNLIKASSQESVENFQLKDNNCVNLSNGIYYFNKGLSEHDLSLRLMTYIDVEYNEKAKCPVWYELLTRVFQSQQEHIDAFEEFIGYAMSACHYDRFNRFLILDGEGANGKSTLLAIIRKLVGMNNTSSIQLEDLSKDRFMGYNLVNKLINFCSEEKREAFSETGPLKRLTGNDGVMVQDKGYPAFNYINIAKFIITYNKMPFFPDDSSGMKRRPILIPCEQDFEKYPELKVKDPVNRIVNSELPGVLLRCIKAYERVLKKGSFTRVVKGEQRVLDMITESDPVRCFVRDHIEVTNNENDYIKPSDLWDRFLDYQGMKTDMKKRGFEMRIAKILDKLGAEKNKIYKHSEEIRVWKKCIYRKENINSWIKDK